MGHLSQGIAVGGYADKPRGLEVGEEALVRRNPLDRGNKGDTRQVSQEKVTSRSAQPGQVPTSRLTSGQDERRESLAKVRRSGALCQYVQELQVPHD